MTRIIAGTWRSRRLAVPKGRDIRPTTDRMRERLFSMLGRSGYPALEGAHILDAFAGTGALGLEALSRGAASATFVEQAPPSLACLKDNIAQLNAGDRAKVIRGSAIRLPKASQAADFIFLDPPYRKGLLVLAIASARTTGWIKPETLIVAECGSDEDFTAPEGFDGLDDRTQGQQRILFLRTAMQD